MTENGTPSPLFDTTGALRRELFESPAWQLLESTLRWLQLIERQFFLPIDIIVVLLQQREPTTHRAIARIIRGNDDSEGLADQLSTLTRRIDRKSLPSAALHANNFSLGFSSLLSDAHEWATESGRVQVSFRDIVRVSRWRAEHQESASVRWALRQLALPGTDRIFDSGGALIEPLFAPALFERLEDSARLSARCGLPFLGTPHLLAALCNDRNTLLWKAAESAGIDPLRVRDELMRVVGPRHPELTRFPLNRRTLTPRVIRILMTAMDHADARNQPVDEVGVLHAFLTDGGSSLEILRALGVEGRLRDRLRSHPDAILPDRPRISRKIPAPASFGRPAASGTPEPERPPTLDTIGRDLTAEARLGLLPPVLGREEELQRVVRVLLRTEQRNPLLTGEPGVGKTAIAVALAQAIHEKRVPAALHGMRVVELNGAALLGGTSYRGELEERIRSILEEAESNTILFIDEAHAVFAPTNTGGKPAEIPNHFKAALASGKISVIAATTDAEYQLWIEQDAALKRRFERVVMEELPTAVTQRILQERGQFWSERYDVVISDEAIHSAIEFSTRFIPEQSQPDKAKKVLMDAAIACSISRPVDAEDERPVVRRADIAEIIHQKTGIPVQRILRTPSAWWRGLRERLQARAPQHPELCDTLAEHLLAQRMGGAAGTSAAQDVFVFGGPPSEAKEALAKALAEELHGSARAFTKLNMSDFQEAHSISRLIGTPPGYVGYQDEDALVTPLRRRPAQVVFLADFHRAHPQVQDRIFRMLDDGSITDMRGMRADCRHATFILSVDVDAPRRGIGFSGTPNASDELKSIAPALAARVEKQNLSYLSFTAPAFDEDALYDEIAARLQHLRDEFVQNYQIAPQFPDDIIERIEAWLRQDHFATRLDHLLDRRIIRPLIAALLRGEPSYEGIVLVEVEDPAFPWDEEPETLSAKATGPIERRALAASGEEHDNAHKR